MSAPVLLDTHALVWWVSAPSQLSAPARAAVDGAESVLVSAASGWEMALLVDAGRLALDRPVRTWLRDVMTRDRIRPVPIDMDIATTSVALARRGFHRDPADRFLYATAARERVPLVTKDVLIQAFAQSDREVTAIW